MGRDMGRIWKELGKGKLCSEYIVYDIFQQKMICNKTRFHKAFRFWQRPKFPLQFVHTAPSYYLSHSFDYRAPIEKV